MARGRGRRRRGPSARAPRPSSTRTTTARTRRRAHGSSPLPTAPRPRGRRGRRARASSPAAAPRPRRSRSPPGEPLVSTTRSAPRPPVSAWTRPAMPAGLPAPPAESVVQPGLDPQGRRQLAAGPCWRAGRRARRGRPRRPGATRAARMPIGPGPDDQHGPAGRHRGALVRRDHDRGRLGEPGREVAHAVGHGVQQVRGDGDLLRHRAVDAPPRRALRGAELGMPAPAQVAGAAGQRVRLADDPRPGCDGVDALADAANDAQELVPEGHRR